MSRYNYCRVCGKRSVSVYNILEQKIIDGIIVGQNRYYCSQECRNRDNRGVLKYFIIVLSIPVLILWRSDFGKFLLFIAVFLGTIVYFVWRRYNQSNSEAVRNIRALINEPEGMSSFGEPDTVSFDEEYHIDADDVPSELTEEEIEELISEENLVATEPEGIIDAIPARIDPKQDGQVYSDILQNYVDPCCYQSARLDDKYCMCGKALVYPTTKYEKE